MTRAVCPYDGRVWAAAVVLAGALAARAAPASAQRVEGTILQIDGSEILVDLGSVDGVSPGEPVMLYRRVSVEHPLTHRRIEDRFPLGAEQLTQVAERMSILILDSPLSHAPAVGDTVVVVGTENAPEDETATDRGPEEGAVCPVCPAPQCPATAVCELDPQAKALLEAFGRTLGQTLEQRIVIWEQYLAANPNLSWSAAVARDVDSLRAMLRTMRGGTPELGTGSQGRTGHAPPAQAFVGEPVEIALAIDPLTPLRLAQLHVRHEEERAYQVYDLEPDGDFYLRGRIPDEYVQLDWFEYFLVGVDANGAEGSLGGTVERPIRVPVVERVGAPPERTDRSNLHTSFEYMDFYANHFHRDYYLRFEADFRYVLGSWFYGLRMGFGIFDGQGGPVDGTDWAGNGDGTDPQGISYRYGFTEVELRFHELFYMMAWISVGGAAAWEDPNDASRSREPEALVGGGGKFRIGRPTGTNLELGGGYIESIGYEANVSVNLGLVEHVPLRGHIIVTNMPVKEGDLGVRLVAEAGWQPASWFEFTALLGYGIRNINHQGLSLGLSVSFLW
ncbi:MAG: hypothetical protein HY905_17635 [Deltaproteobacteria bacterium]|nr:hypothetical protein [Deltaproteobacteria bacterium]